MSNSFSKSRNTQKRPKVCRTERECPPDDEEPECGIDPRVLNIDSGDILEVKVFANVSGFDPTANVLIQMDGVGVVFLDFTIMNDGEQWTVEVEADQAPGDYPQVVVFKIGNSVVCTADFLAIIA